MHVHPNNRAVVNLVCVSELKHFYKERDSHSSGFGSIMYTNDGALGPRLFPSMVFYYIVSPLHTIGKSIFSIASLCPFVPVSTYIDVIFQFYKP